ncbi:hypothetical protein DU258_24680 [Salmonella enterica subsp. enterica]|nr:hypothetical protein [Salmonella enterica subsp. enterica serovar Kambole]MKD05594.1 hypothetical protein [Salmonella enterica subsp. enterica serovar Kambole]
MPLLRANQLRDVSTLYMQHDVTADFPEEAACIARQYGVSASAVLLCGSIHCADVAVYIREQGKWRWLCMAENIFDPPED